MHKAVVAEIQQTHSSELECVHTLMKSIHEDHAAALLNERALAAAEAVESVTTALSDKSRALLTKLEEAVTQREQEIAALRSQIDSLEGAHAVQLEQLQHTADAELLAMDHMREQEIVAAEREHSAQKDMLCAHHDSLLQSVKKEHLSILEKERYAWTAELSILTSTNRRLEAEGAEDVDRLTEGHAIDLRELRAYHSEDILRVSAAHEQEVEVLKKISEELSAALERR